MSDTEADAVVLNVALPQGRPPSKGPAIVAALEAAGIAAHAEGDRIIVRPIQRVTPELRALVAEHRDAVLAALRVRRLMDMAPRPCTACARLERGVYCTYYMHVMLEPARECRCVYFKELLPWA